MLTKRKLLKLLQQCSDAQLDAPVYLDNNTDCLPLAILSVNASAAQGHLSTQPQGNLVEDGSLVLALEY